MNHSVTLKFNSPSIPIALYPISCLSFMRRERGVTYKFLAMGWLNMYPQSFLLKQSQRKYQKQPNKVVSLDVQKINNSNGNSINQLICKYF